MPRELLAQVRLPYSNWCLPAITMPQALLPQHAYGMGPSSIFGYKHTFNLHLTLRVASYQVTNLLVVFDTFSEKSTFFQKFTTPLKYSIKLQMLKNHHRDFGRNFWQSYFRKSQPGRKQHFPTSLPSTFLYPWFLSSSPGSGRFFPKKKWFCLVNNSSPNGCGEG